MGKYRYWLWFVAAAGLFGSAACDSARGPLPGYPSQPGEIPPTSAQCRACHGSTDSPAPPRGVHGQTATTDPGVGAHQAHLTASATHAAIACETCHVVPKSIYALGHLDETNARAEVQFTGLALANGATASYDDKNLTCATYCHGTTLKAPGKNSLPLWTKVDGSQRSCDSCHGLVPPAPHPAATDCAGCHAATAGPNQTILHPERHIDGHVDVVLGPTVSCGGCHGAPPTTDKHPKVAENSCSQCHVDTVDAQMLLLPAGKHMNGKVEVALAANANCASCHGAPPVSDKHPKLWVENCEKCHAATVGPNMALLSGGTHINGKVDFAIAPQTCDACHAALPTVVGPSMKPHPKMTRCGKCHASSIDDAGKILAGGTHTNGKLDMVLPTACDACHGAPGSLGAPPPDHEGKTDPSLPSVGAHAAHILGKNYSKGGVTCTSCHVLPTSVDAPGHMYGLSTIFLDAASTWLGKATFDQPSQTCSGVSCHGAAIGGGTVPVPKWTQATIACDGCHGLPPPPSSGHVATDPTKGTQACALCHKKTVKADGSLDIQGGYHINGLVDP